MNNIPYGFQNPLLAQQKLLENSIPEKQHAENYDIIDENPRIYIMTVPVSNILKLLNLGMLIGTI